jgi:hypothetical protein
MSEGIKRAGPPQAVQKIRDSFYLVQVPLSDVPSADWKRLFYDAQQSPPADFPPRTVDMNAHLLRFRTDASQVQEKIVWIDKWIARANQKEAGMGGRMEEERRRRREELQREQAEIAELNQRWEKL